MEELAEGLRKQGSPVAQKELEARARLEISVLAIACIHAMSLLRKIL